MQQIANDDELALAGVHARHDLGMKPAIGLVAVFLCPYPFAVFRVVHDDKLRLVLQVAQPSNLLPTGPGKDAHAVRQDDVLLLPLLAFALEREILDYISLDLAVVLLDERVRFELVLDRRDVERRLAGRIGDKNDERVLFGVFERGP